MRFVCERSVLFCLLLMALSMTLSPVCAHRVPEDFPTIQAAIDALPDGSVVEVATGVVSGDIHFTTRSIELVAAPGGPRPQMGNLYFVEGPVTVRDFVITGHLRMGGNAETRVSSVTIDSCQPPGGLICQLRGQSASSEILIIEMASLFGFGSVSLDLEGFARCELVGARASLSATDIGQLDILASTVYSVVAASPNVPDASLRILASTFPDYFGTYETQFTHWKSVQIGGSQFSRGSHFSHIETMDVSDSSFNAGVARSGSCYLSGSIMKLCYQTGPFPGLTAMELSSCGSVTIRASQFAGGNHGTFSDGCQGIPGCFGPPADLPGGCGISITDSSVRVSGCEALGGMGYLGRADAYCELEGAELIIEAPPTTETPTPTEPPPTTPVATTPEPSPTTSPTLTITSTPPPTISPTETPPTTPVLTVTPTASSNLPAGWILSWNSSRSRR